MIYSHQTSPPYIRFCCEYPPGNHRDWLPWPYLGKIQNVFNPLWVQLKICRPLHFIFCWQTLPRYDVLSDILESQFRPTNISTLYLTQYLITYSAQPIYAYKKAQLILVWVPMQAMLIHCHIKFNCMLSVSPLSTVRTSSFDYSRCVYLVRTK